MKKHSLNVQHKMKRLLWAKKISFGESMEEYKME